MKDHRDGHGWAAGHPGGPRKGHRLFGRLDARDNERRAPAWLLSTDHAMAADCYPLRLIQFIRLLWPSVLEHDDNALSIGHLPIPT